MGLSVDARRHDFGAATQGDPLSHTFTLKNDGPNALSIAEVRAGHSCSGEPDATLIAPRGTAKLRVTCQPRLHGAFFDTLTVVARDDPAPLRLELAARLEPLLVFDRQLLELRLPFGAEATETIGLRGARAREARLEIIDDGDAGFQLEVLSQGPNAPQALRVRWKPKTVGRQGGRILLATGLEQPREVELQFLAEALGTLSVTPTNPYFNLRDPSANHLIDVRSSTPGFAITAVDTEGPFSAAFERASEGHYRVRVSVSRERLHDNQRGVSGTLVIRSSDRTEPEKRLPLFGFGKPAP